MTPLRLLAFRFIVLALLGSAHSTAFAQSPKPEEYKRVIEGAVLDFASGNWSQARVLFEQAHTLRPSARTLRGMGKVSFGPASHRMHRQRHLLTQVVAMACCNSGGFGQSSALSWSVAR